MNDNIKDKIMILEEACLEARKFIQRSNAWIKKLKSDELSYLTGSKESAACKRTSMDLTRLLVKVRKPF